jgi:hypothetical protein
LEDNDIEKSHSRRNFLYLISYYSSKKSGILFITHISLSAPMNSSAETDKLDLKNESQNTLASKECSALQILYT